MTTPIGNDKISTPQSDKPSRRDERHATSATAVPASGTTDQPRSTAGETESQIERANQLYAQREAASPPAVTLSDAGAALALAQQLHRALFAEPSAGVTAHRALTASAVQAALAPPTS